MTTHIVSLFDFAPSKMSFHILQRAHKTADQLCHKSVNSCSSLALSYTLTVRTYVHALHTTIRLNAARVTFTQLNNIRDPLTDTCELILPFIINYSVPYLLFNVRKKKTLNQKV